MGLEYVSRINVHQSNDNQRVMGVLRQRVYEEPKFLTIAGRSHLLKGIIHIRYGLSDITDRYQTTSNLRGQARLP